MNQKARPVFLIKSFSSQGITIPVESMEHFAKGFVIGLNSIERWQFEIVCGDIILFACDIAQPPDFPCILSVFYGIGKLYN